MEIGEHVRFPIPYPFERVEVGMITEIRDNWPFPPPYGPGRAIVVHVPSGLFICHEDQVEELDN